MYATGQVGPKNATEAVQWYRRAAEQDLADAQFNLGVMYTEGEGVPENYIEAYKWLSLSRGQGEWDEEQAQFWDELRSLMTPAQIAGAQRLAAEW